ncbi:MAG: TerB family tellurite resistance protein [Gammaproteobacteria bacterium]|nr:TerB family tellurite resistance protein [Gammaproteobacteria bacterium]
MLKKIQKFYNQFLQPESAEVVDTEHQLRLAATTLMVEVMRVDDQKTDEEKSVLMNSIMVRFSIEQEEAAVLLSLATEELHQATDYHQFTSLINKGYDQQQKQMIIEHLWQVAYADGELDVYEEHVIRKISDLIYVAHKDFIRIKEKVRNT